MLPLDLPTRPPEAAATGHGAGSVTIGNRAVGLAHRRQSCRRFRTDIAGCVGVADLCRRPDQPGRRFHRRWVLPWLRNASHPAVTLSL